MRFAFIIITLIFCFETIAQKQNTFQHNYPIDLRKASTDFNKVYLGKDDTSNDIIEYLKANNYNLTNCELRLINSKRSISGTHYLFQQTINNIEVYLGEIKVNINNEGFITSIIDNSFNPKLVCHHIKPSTNNINNEIYFYNGTSLIHAKKTLEGNNIKIITTNSNSVVYEKELNLYLKDTTAYGTVFMPDPLTTANVPYGTPYIDSNDDDIDELNNERDTVVLYLKYDELKDTFLLENDFVKITDHSFPYIDPATSPNNTFYYTRSQSGFEDVNAFYHITEFKNYIKSLGFNNLMNYQIHIDTHGLNGQDNSAFMSSFNPPRISFGEGFVDDAEDADVIVHEYTHAIMYDATGQDPSGTERQTLDEANGDILASSYSRNISEFRWDKVYTWDGHNEFWNGRMTSGDKHYPDDLQNNKYLDTDIWSAAIMEIWEKIGRETTDKLLIESSYSYSTGMSMRDAARLFLEADTALNNGNNTWDICITMLTRGLLQECLTSISNEVSINDKITLWNTDNFSNDKEPAILYAIDSIDIQLSFFDLSGRLVLMEEYTDVERILISPNKFDSGIYILKATYGDKEKTFKLVKN